MNTIFEYLDYRDFLKDFYEERKREHSFFSFRLFGSKIEIDASYLAKVIIKTRHISDRSIPKIVAFCKMNPKEGEYFEALVQFVKATKDKESKLYFEKLLSLKNVGANRLSLPQYEFYQKWYHSAIRSLVEFYDFKGNFKELAEKLSPPISTKEARESVRLLEKLGLIKKDENGRYCLTDAAITTGPEWQSLAIQAFQEETIRLSLGSLSRHSRQVRDISSVTMNIDINDFIEIRERVNEFRNSIIKFVNEKKTPDRTYQMNIQFFPISHVEDLK